MVLRRGSGEPLLLLHGLGASAGVWEPVIALLTDEREVTALDMPGFGSAPALPRGTEPSAANLAVALRARCAELGIERPHVAGNSLGGWVGLEMGRAGWAASVTALSPAGLWRAPPGPRRRDTRAWARRLRPLVSLALLLPAARTRMLSALAARPGLIPPPAGRKLVLGWIDANGYDSANKAMRSHAFEPSGFPPALPVTIAWGERDRLVGPPRADRRPANARFLVMPGVGHTPMWDDPKLVARVLLEGSAAGPTRA
jgi:pimeloyl-ACP methyl ester carboxylesterase